MPLETDGSLSNYRETKPRLILSGLLLGCAVLIFVCPIGCRTERIEDIALRLGPIHDAIRSRTATEFERATLWKPSDDSPANDLIALAPLIVQEIEKDPRESESSSVDDRRPTMYAAWSLVSLNGIDHQLAQYAWTYPADLGEEGLPSLNWTFLLGLVDGDGFALLWSCVSHHKREQPADLHPYQLFVSKSLELSAKHARTSPSLSRRYAIEPPLDRSPQLVVAGLIEDGPVPMGPYVYLDGRQRRPVTLLCRCSPSQVNEFVQSDYYELRPLDDLRAAMSEKSWSAFEEDARCRRDEFLKTVSSLRWPESVEPVSGVP